MAQKNAERESQNPRGESLTEKVENEYREKIEKWWFDVTLYHKNSPGQTETELKKYYAFIQVYYHDNFRKSSTGIDKYLKELIKKVESERRDTDSRKKEQKLRALILGNAYRRLGQFKTERYQSAETEQNKAIDYLEQDTSFFELMDSGNTDADEEDFVIMLLFLLNKAKYFRDIAEKDSIRVDASYRRSIMLFREIKRKIEERQEQCQNAPIEGVLARIYVNAWLNIAQVYRFQQKYDSTAAECVGLVGFCIRSLKDEEKRDKIQKIVNKLPQMQGMDQVYGFSAQKFGQRKENTDYLFEDFILQALLQLGISNRDRVDFNGSQEGNFWVRQAMGVFLALGIVDRFKDSGADGSPEKITKHLDTLQGLDPDSMSVPQSLVVEIKKLCVGDKNAGKGSELKNADAQNNLAVCLKKLGYYADAIAILSDADLKGNKFAEYNLYKSYLESGLIEDMKIMNRDFCKMEQENNGAAIENPAQVQEPKTIYVYPKEPEKSNYKWLFLYARYLFVQGRLEEAEKLFSHIRNSRAMRWDSLELKAAYLEAQCQIHREKYLSAIASLNNIHESLLKLGNDNSASRHEIRTEIDLGWCLIVEDRYKEALGVYSDLLAYLMQDTGGPSPEQNGNGIEAALEKLKESMSSTQSPETGAVRPYAMKWYTVDSESQEKILHNLYDCWTYLHMNEPEGINDPISELIEEICQSINSSNIYISYLQSLRKMNLIKKGAVKDNIHSQWEMLSNTFDEILKERSHDTITYCCWVIGKANYCLGIPKQLPEFEVQKKQLLLGLASSTMPITMKSYIEVARVILDRSEDGRFLDIDKYNKEKEEMELERAFLELFCHMNLLENGTNQAFMKLMTNQDFHSIELVTRAELLANIVGLYGDILQLKTQLRVTYADLKAFESREQDGSVNKETRPIICQYTKLSTLKGILPRMVRGTDGEAVEKEPRFRMSNAARMNDASEGAMFMKICRKVAKNDILGIKVDKYESIIEKYINNSSGYKSTDEISSYDSDVYIASFSMDRNNFGLWSNYADKEKGCIIGFDQSFFDLVDKNHYSILDDEAEENALYRIMYVNEQELLTGKRNLGIKSFKGEDDSAKADDAEKGNTEKEDIETIKTCIPNIMKKLCEIERILESEDSIVPEAAGVVRAFIVDRLNEIRFLFKSVSYAYEEEMRMLRCSQSPEVDMGDSCAIPWLYINVEKRLDNLTLILGSKVGLQQVKELFVWAKSTGRVKQVIWSGLNRL